MSGSRPCDRIRALVLAALFVVAVTAPAIARSLSFEERVAAQQSIEAVYWRHRIWPAANPAPKPALSAVLSEQEIRAKVLDYLEKSNALERWWQQPVTGEQLQAEIERMTRDSRAPQLLRELYAAVGNDPRMIAETLARPTLVERLVRSWYATDGRFHGALRERAEAALAACARVECMSSMGGAYGESSWKLKDDEPPGEAPDAALNLDSEEWGALLDRLAARVGGSPQSLSTRRLGRLEETADAFVVTAVLAASETRIRTTSVVWRKRPFDEWWAGERETLRSSVEELPAAFVLPVASALDSPCTNDAWTPSSPGLPVARYGHTAVWTGAEMIVWGGTNGSSIMNSGGRYNPSTDSWTTTSMGEMLPDRRYDHTAVWTGTEMIVWGGRGEPALNLNTGGRYRPSTDDWQPTSTGIDVPVARHVHTAVWTGTKMIVWGGLTTPGFYANSGGRYDPSTDGWTATSTGTNVPTPRYRHTAIWTGSRMIVWGGYDGSYANSGALYDPLGNSWTPTSMGTNVPSGRYYQTAVWTGGVMIVWGGSYFDGENYQSLNTGGRYDPAADSWTPTSIGAGAPSARLGHTAVWTGSQMLVWGGGSQPGTGSRYNPSTNSWVATSTGAGAPGGRTGHTAVWTGTEMIVWGGSNSSSQVNTGGRYKPSTNSWVATSTQTTVPDMRRWHTIVWTGAELIVWGGSNDVSTFMNNGGRYDPSTDDWTPTSTGTNVPSARYNHTAVWTGTEMIVWGGGQQVNTGGRYRPATNGWTTTSTGAGVPEGRYDHTAVWTGTGMIVWGGWAAGAYANTGGVYDPTSDSWTATSTGANVPAGRAYHTAVWTGAEMIVWGGSPLTNTGGRYMPSADAWMPTSLETDVPAARMLHTAVWSGTEMIVWGGKAGYAYLNSGGRYNAATDAWAPTSTGAGVPAIRTNHAAVWTGAEMIVWGGYNLDWATTVPLNTGGRYDPTVDGWTATSTGANVLAERYDHAAVFTGQEMMIWGGFPYSPDLGRYCACPSALTVYRDADADGFGNPGISITRCDGSVSTGYVVNADDCKDSDATTHPGATEICDGVDNDCNTLIDDAIAAPAGQAEVLGAKLGAAVVLGWSPMDGASGYDVVWGSLSVLRSGGGDFTAGTSGCLEDGTTETSAPHEAIPVSEDGFWYLVRPVNCGGNGTYDSGPPGQAGSRDAEIAASALSCP